jgi:hypothetical protein
VQQPRGNGELLEQKRRKGRRVGVMCRRRREARGERIDFMIRIIIENATVFPNALEAL